MTQYHNKKAKKDFSLLESKASKAALQKVLYGHIKFKATQKFNDPIQKSKIRFFRTDA